MKCIHATNQFNLDLAMVIISTKPKCILIRTLYLLSFLGMCLYSSSSFPNELSEAPVSLPPGFSLPDLEGQLRSLDNFSGKVILVSFWASWCRPCIEEIPSLQRLMHEMTDYSFLVVGVNVGEGIRRVQATVQRLDIRFPVLLDKDSSVFTRWGAHVLPTAYILDGNGNIRYVGQGPVEWDRADIIDLLRDIDESQL